MRPRGSEIGIVSIAGCGGPPYTKPMEHPEEDSRMSGSTTCGCAPSPLPVEDVERVFWPPTKLAVCRGAETATRAVSVGLLTTRDGPSKKSKLAFRCFTTNGLPISSTFTSSTACSPEIRPPRPGAVPKRRGGEPAERSHMTYITKAQSCPSVASPRNELGFTRRDYEGAPSPTLLRRLRGMTPSTASHSTEALLGACRSEPQNVVKLSGIGCSSKTTALLLS